MSKEHTYDVTVRWTGNNGTGTSGYDDYARDSTVSAGDKPPILGSADTAFRGEAGRWNPEEMLVAALAQCHMLWFLHLASVNGVVVVDYSDAATGSMASDDGGAAAFTEVILHPQVTVTEQSMVRAAQALHTQASRMCFIARSVNFPVRHQPDTVLA